MTHKLQDNWNLFKFALSACLKHGQSRHLLSWLRSLDPDYLLATASPWLTFDAAEFIRRRLAQQVSVFEYGSGGSTLFWLQFQPIRLVSIEHNRDWFTTLSQKIMPITFIDYRYVAPEIQQTDRVTNDPADPNCYVSGDEQFSHCTFRNYATQIDEFPNESFDVVLVDGRARPSCIKHSVTKVKPGGMLILDNADRTYYTQKTRLFLQGFEANIFCGLTPGATFLASTNVYIKR